MTIVRLEDKDSWLSWRREQGNEYYGASEASVCAGLNPWQTEADLYLEKAGIKPVQDISGKDRVIYGSEAEEPIRRLFELDYRDKVRIEHNPFWVYLDDRYPFVGATLDGILEWTGEPFEVLSPTGYLGVIDTGSKGVYEGKTAQVRDDEAYESWQMLCPDWYFAQGCQQLYVMRELADFWLVNSMVERVRFRKTSEGFVERFPKQQIVRHVYFKDDPIVKASTEFVISKVVEMHWRVENRITPPTRIGV